MILDAIIIENFGAYGDRQEAKLSPEPGKPIVLFGGLNGGGKTTLLDAIQLAFYGDKARISNRGRRGYKEYLLESIHRGADPSDGASITLRFRRMIDGEERNFELLRSWRQGIRGIEESIRVLRDGQFDDVFTNHWDEVIDAYLPSSIAHLFFFDGEQIMELAEGGHAADILGTAVHSLLGLDLVDRLETDLKVFERRKRSETLDATAIERLNQIRKEIEELDREQEAIAIEEGQLVNIAGRAAKDVQNKEEQFRLEGGDLFQQRVALEEQKLGLLSRINELASSFRELSAGPLPLTLIEPLLMEVERQVRHEREIRHAKAVVEILEERDSEVLIALKEKSIQGKIITEIERTLNRDRTQRRGLASEQLLLDAPEGLAPKIEHFRAFVLPTAIENARKFSMEMGILKEKLARIETDLERVPTAERIAEAQQNLAVARDAHSEFLAKLDSMRLHKELLHRKRQDLEDKLDKIGTSEMDAQVAIDDRDRMLKHAQKVRKTLDTFRTKVVKRHTDGMETLMLESFQKLLRKTNLVQALNINAETFEPTLFGRDGRALPFDRLSAGERQLLATSMLWGLARASGRPVPTVIDTPLGRLDSDHRTNLIERYFPNASHQVILLSTDEEIVDGYLDALKPYVSRKFRLVQNGNSGSTKIEEGYFS
jgi:DNA sulfur modification protein DndD